MVLSEDIMGTMTVFPESHSKNERRHRNNQDQDIEGCKIYRDD